ncbi:hypothetical protein FACS1894152_3220 [Bacilli bacterium]|nr:hypothetical protein FACS1894152_3220 [Bacilli bacterium]
MVETEGDNGEEDELLEEEDDDDDTADDDVFETPRSCLLCSILLCTKSIIDL